MRTSDIVASTASIIHIELESQIEQGDAKGAEHKHELEQGEDAAAEEETQAAADGAGSDG